MVHLSPNLCGLLRRLTFLRAAWWLSGAGQLHVARLKWRQPTGRGGEGRREVEEREREREREGSFLGLGGLAFSLHSELAALLKASNVDEPIKLGGSLRLTWAEDEHASFFGNV